MLQYLNHIQDRYFITSTTDLNGIITSVSQAFCKISGYSEEELVGKSHSIFRHPDMEDEVFTDMWKTIKVGNVWNGVVKNKKKDGGYYWVDSTIEPIRDDDGNIVGFISVRFDITDKYTLIERECELLKSQYEYESLYNNIHSGIALMDYSSQFISANEYILELFGYTLNEFLQYKCKDLTYNRENTLSFEELLIGLRETDTGVIRFEKQCIKKDGSLIWVEVSYSLAGDNKVLISMNSIESYKKLQEATALITKNLKDAAMGEMIAMIAHQWRQPLTTIATIMTKAKIKSEIGKYNVEENIKDIDSVNSIVQHLSKTVDFFSNYMKPKSTNKETLEHVVESVLNIVKPIANKHNVNIKADLNNTGDFRIDITFSQVLLNLLKNGIDACYEKNGNGIINILAHSYDDKMYIDILDNGGGIKEGNIDKIFEPYFSTKSKNGTGLGLYMSKNIIQDVFHGSIDVSNSDDGAMFCIVIPFDNSKNQYK